MFVGTPSSTFGSRVLMMVLSAFGSVLTLSMLALNLTIACG